MPFVLNTGVREKYFCPTGNSDLDILPQYIALWCNVETCQLYVLAKVSKLKDNLMLH